MDAVDIFSKVAFPVAVAAFVLVRLNGKLERLTIGVEKLAERIERLLDQH